MSADGSATFPDPIEGMIAFGAIAIFAGPPKLGKTAMTASWLARLRDGRSICGFKTNPPPKIGIVTCDHMWQHNQGPWFTKAGFGDIPHYAFKNEPIEALNWDRFRKWQEMRELFVMGLDKLSLPPGSFVCFDPLSMFLAGRLIDYKDVAIGLNSLHQILRHRQLTMLGIFHMAKQRGGKDQQYLRPQERILGSGAQIGFSDTAIYMLGPEDLDTDYYGVGILPTHAEASVHCFERDKITGLFIPAKASVHSTKVLGQLGGVLELFPPDATPIQIKDLVVLAEHVSISRATLKRYLQALEQDTRIYKVKHGWYARRTVQ